MTTARRRRRRRVRRHPSHGRTQQFGRRTTGSLRFRRNSISTWTLSKPTPAPSPLCRLPIRRCTLQPSSCHRVIIGIDAIYDAIASRLSDARVHAALLRNLRRIIGTQCRQDGGTLRSPRMDSVLYHRRDAVTLRSSYVEGYHVLTLRYPAFAWAKGTCKMTRFVRSDLLLEVRALIINIILVYRYTCDVSFIIHK